MVRDPCEVARKTDSGTDPEPWSHVDNSTRLIAISSISDRRAIEATATGRYSRTPTHTALAGYDAELQPLRMLKRVRDGAYFLILSTRPHGRPRRGATHAPQVRMMLAYEEGGHTW